MAVISRGQITIDVYKRQEESFKKRSLHHGRGNNYIRGEWVSSEDYNTI